MTSHMRFPGALARWHSLPPGALTALCLPRKYHRFCAYSSLLRHPVPKPPPQLPKEEKFNGIRFAEGVCRQRLLGQIHRFDQVWSDNDDKLSLAFLEGDAAKQGPQDGDIAEQRKPGDGLAHALVQEAS